MRVIALSLRSARNPFDVEWRRFQVRGEEEEEFSTGQNVEEEDKDISKIKKLDIIFLSGLVVDVSADGRGPSWSRPNPKALGAQLMTF
jgi:hypothetical protein